MTEVSITVNGRELRAEAHETILEVCRASGIPIPTLCHDDHLEPLGGCLICTVEVAGHGMVPSCATTIWPGMTVQTDSERVRSARKRRLEELLASHYGDCTAPCELACPAGIDVQGYIHLIARGRLRDAVALIKERVPMPAVLGRVCPHPCEEACRRNLVDEPLAICHLKRTAADYDLFSSEPMYVPPRGPDSGRRVAVVGAGPAGLACAFYLARMGHAVVVFEALPQPGGMLRYGIPDYRLPKDILDREIAAIAQMGVDIRTGCALGRDITLQGLLQEGYDACFLAIGAHKSQRMRVEGEELEGVLPGTDFLRACALGQPMEVGRRVAVVGGGNTAIDAARTALRMGAEEVTIVYRRSRAEMPASEWEVEEAEEEGIRLHFLAAPTTVNGRNGRVASLSCTRMALGEPDASGRPRPEPIPGSEFTVPVDSVIAAIGQGPDISFSADGLQIGRGDVIVADEETLQTDIEGVFAGGDAVTGPARAVDAMAAGRKAAISIDRYLRGEPLADATRPFNWRKGELDELGGEEFATIERQPRRAMPRLRPDERQGNFQEIERGYTQDLAQKEAQRCLACGCGAVESCTLRHLAADYGVSPSLAREAGYHYPVDSSHPFVEIDANKCIMCARCARTCLSVQGVGAWSFAYRVAVPPGARSLADTTCESCGLCIASCPVGALVSKGSRPPLAEVKTVCPYCGVGCSLYLGVVGNTIVDVRGDPESPVNRGKTCVKGRFGIADFVSHPERLTTPLVRKAGGLVPASWDEALELIASRLPQYRGERFALIASARCTNEENYLLQKFARAVMGTNNVDHCARLCHAPSVSGLAQSFGSGAMTNSIAEIGQARCIFAIGTNTTASHPIIGLEIKDAVRRGAALIVANPRHIDLCRFATVWLQQRPGSDVALLMGMMRVIVEQGLIDTQFIEERCENYAEFRESLEWFDAERVEQLTGVPQKRIAEAARLYAESSPATILYAMGITQHSHGTDNVIATANLAMLTGNVGRASTGVNPLRGQNNVQGACDMGALPNVYPGYQGVADPNLQVKFESAWDVTLNPAPGLTLTEMVDAAYRGEVRAIYLVGENPLLSEPDATHVEQALKNLDFLVVQDIFLSETAQLADVVLPAASFAEKDGTFTNTERRVQRVRRAIDPVGEALPDWQIVCRIAQRMGAGGFDFSHPSQVFDEIAGLSPAYGGISYQRLEEGGLAWPCPFDDHPGTPILHTQLFSRGLGRFIPLTYRPPLEEPSSDYPLVLTTERLLNQYHTGTMTRRVAGLNQIRGQELVEINPADAERLGIGGGDRVRVASRRGEVFAHARVTDGSPPGVVSMSFHFTESRTNIVTNPGLDPVAKIPELKVAAVRVERA